jgi:mitochondrial-processing peptidase subunit alpha
MYQSSHFHKATPLALSIIADTVLNPSFHPEELDSQRDTARYELREVSTKPEMFLPEVLHDIAYGGKGLGNPLLCPEERIDVINKELLQSCLKDWYRPERIVVAGLGMQHEELVELVDKYFGSLKPLSTQSLQMSTSRQATPGPSQIPPHLLSQSPPSMYTRAASSYPGLGHINKALHPASPTDPPSMLNEPTSTYTGGYHFIHAPDCEFDHLYVAFEGVGIHDDDIYPLATMQVLLGGGGSFSAGLSVFAYPFNIVLIYIRGSWKGHVLTVIHPNSQPLSSN